MAEQRYCYEHPRPAVTTDVVLFRTRGEAREVLLIQRKNDPYEGRWAFPGGFLDENEPLESAARRELHEETGIEAATLGQFAAYGDPGRDPRGHTVTIVFTGEVTADVEGSADDDAADARWFPLEKLPELAFDHGEILRDVLATQNLS